MLKKSRLYLSTIDPQAGELARKYGIGVEIADFCTAANMDDGFRQTDAAVQEQIRDVLGRMLHGPFNELFPCAIDPMARKLAAFRYRQALTLARHYGAQKLILHGGFHPRTYYPCWYVEQSVLFWREFLGANPGDYRICLENVLEDTPEMLLSIVEQVNDPRLALCLDVGHVNAYSRVPVTDWVKTWGTYLSHAHIHNNDGTADSHSALHMGTLDVESVLQTLDHATITLELPEIDGAVDWLTRHGGILDE